MNADVVPVWARSIRLRLTLLYSLVLFSLAAIVVAVIYLLLAAALDDEPISRERQTLVLTPVAPQVFTIEQQTVHEELRSLESAVNERAMEKMRSYSFLALGGLFVASLGVGWAVSGRVLAPIDHITGVAREIQATDLSRRISMHGPDDELKRLADTFDDMLERLDAAFEGQRRFIQEASHELRNPLAVARTNVEVALSDPAAPPGELRHSLEVVGRSIDRMGRVVGDLLVYARHERPGIRPEYLDVAALAQRAVGEFAGPADAEGVELRVDAGEGLWVMADEAALGRAVTNLLANALRHTPAGGAVAVSTGRRAERVYLRVSDDGPGIEPADQQAVFRRYWAGEGGGTGLGLSIVRQVAEAHRGEVEVCSDPPNGATFTVWLPAAAEPAPC